MMRRAALSALSALLLCACTSTAIDFDGDGTIDTEDCAPEDAAIHPGQTEDCDDGIDNDCDGDTDAADDACIVEAQDADADGYPEGIDCDDGDPAIHPGADEVCDDGVDNDCDADVDAADAECEVAPTDADGDGYPETVDCDDEAAAVHPGATEDCGNAIDDDCDGDADGADNDCTADLTPCEAAELLASNVGCTYFAVDLDNAENPFDNAAAATFAVAVAYAGTQGVASVTVEINDADPGEPLAVTWIDTADLNPGDQHVFELPRRDVDGENVTDHVDDGTQTWLSSRAFRITSTRPVVAYQFNSLDVASSADATLLLPTSGLGHDHTVVGYPPSYPQDGDFSPRNRSYVTVVGTEPGATTTVAVTPTFDVAPGDGVSEVSPGIGIAAGTTRSFTLGEFDVLNLESRLQPAGGPTGNVDPTGTTVSSSRPVAVFTGVDLTTVDAPPLNSEGACCAEHLEQQVFPDFAVARSYAVARSPARGTPAEPDVYRVLALEAAQVTTNLPAPWNSFALQAGELAEFAAVDGFVLEADAPVQVIQLLVSGTEVTAPRDGETGDPSMIAVPGVAQRQRSYVFTTGVGYTQNYAVFSAPATAVLLLDGQPLVAGDCTAPAPEGTLEATAYTTRTCAIAEGAHAASSSNADFGLTIYGYGPSTSYGYAAGAGLREIAE